MAISSWISLESMRLFAYALNQVFLFLILCYLYSVVLSYTHELYICTLRLEAQLLKLEKVGGDIEKETQKLQFLTKKQLGGFVSRGYFSRLRIIPF